jgi:hypothetical protein
LQRHVGVAAAGRARPGRRAATLARLLLLAVLACGAASAVDAAEGDPPGARLILKRWLLVDRFPDAPGATADPERLAPLGSEPLESDEWPFAGVAPRFTVRDPASNGPARHLLDLNLQAAGQLLGGTVTNDLELLGYDPRDDAEAPADGGRARLLRVGVRSDWGWVESGVRFQSVTRGLERVMGAGVKPDQEGAGVWLATRSGRVRLRALADAFHDNVLDDPRRPRTATTEAGVRLELPLPSQSLLTLGASHGQWARAPGARQAGADAALPDGDFESLLASVYLYGGPTWDVSLSSTHTLTAAPDGAETSATAHDLSGSYRPFPGLTLTPAVSVAESAPREAEAGSQSFTGSLTLVVSPLTDALDLTLYGGYSRSRTTDGAFDGRSVSGAGSLVWHLRRASPRASLALEVGYHRYLDAAAWSSRYEETVGVVVLRIASF